MEQQLTIRISEESIAKIPQLKEYLKQSFVGVVIEGEGFLTNDYVRIINSSRGKKLSAGTIGKVMYPSGSGLEYWVIDEVTGKKDHFPIQQLIVATEKEIERMKSSLVKAHTFRKAGRRPYEFKVGDVISFEEDGEIVIQQVTAITTDHVVTNTQKVFKEDCALVCPVEIRIDR